MAIRSWLPPEPVRVTFVLVVNNRPCLKSLLRLKVTDDSLCPQLNGEQCYNKGYTGEMEVELVHLLTWR